MHLRLVLLIIVILVMFAGCRAVALANALSSFAKVSNSLNNFNEINNLEGDEAQVVLKREKASLVIRARIFAGGQDEEELFVTGAKFLLLDENLVTILQKSGFEIEGTEGKAQDSSDYLLAAVNTLRYPDEAENGILLLLLSDSLKKHQRAEIETNHWGEAHPANIRAGKYYLFGYAEVDEELFIWNLPLNIKAGRNLLELDQYNAE